MARRVNKAILKARKAEERRRARRSNAVVAGSLFGERTPENVAWRGEVLGQPNVRVHDLGGLTLRVIDVVDDRGMVYRTDVPLDVDLREHPDQAREIAETAVRLYTLALERSGGEDPNIAAIRALGFNGPVIPV